MDEEARQGFMATLLLLASGLPGHDQRLPSFDGVGLVVDELVGVGLPQLLDAEMRAAEDGRQAARRPPAAVGCP